jgi:hypothetical protein
MELSEKALARIKQIKAKLRFIEATNRILEKKNRYPTKRSGLVKLNSFNIKLAASLRG